MLQEKTSDASKKVKGTAEQKTKKAEQKLSSVRRKGESTVTAEAKLRQAHSMLETLAADEEDTYAEVSFLVKIYFMRVCMPSLHEKKKCISDR